MLFRRRKKEAEPVGTTPEQPAVPPVAARQEEAVDAVQSAGSLSVSSPQSAASGPTGTASQEGPTTPARTRRGGRGGRRKTTSAAVPAPEAGATTAAGGREATTESGRDAPAPAQAAPAKRTRRGRRGGSSRQRADGTSAAEAAGSETKGTDAEPKAEGASQEKPSKPRSRRAKQAPAPAEAGEAATGQSREERSKPGRGRRTRPVPVSEREVKDKTVIASDDLGEVRVAVVEDGRLAEVYLQRPERPSLIGNIYKARVQSVLKGMDAAFVDFGLEKNGFLHVDEVTVPDDGPRRGRRITQLLQSGQEVLVQVTKDPMKGKGARLTTRSSLPGRYLVYVPDGSGVGVSRRLPQAERDRLRDVCKQLKARNAGLIVRTVAEGKGIDELRRDLQYLSRLWSRIRTKAEKTAAPALIHEEVDIGLTAARDVLDESCTKFVVDSRRLQKSVVTYLQRVAPELVDRVELYEGDEPLFESYGVEDAIDATLSRRAMLPSGGNLVIDHTEALTVVDVNSGKYTGGSGLEETITRTNMEAAEEVVRQLRLRDIGGIIVIDFIDMAKRQNREAVLARLETALAQDKTKSYVVEISPLGLVEMTRQSTTEGTRGLMTVACPTCHSTARVLSAESMARNVERTLRRSLKGIGGAAVLVEVQRDVAQKLEGSEQVRRLERDFGKRVFFEGSSTLPVDAYRVVASGALKDVQAQRLPVQEGQELEVELRHALPFSPRDAVATIDGYQLVVTGGRAHLGGLRKVRVETALRSGGTAVLLSKGRGGLD